VSSIWDDKPELVERLKELNTEGEHSLSQIARILGNGLSRNAICGKLHRMKLPIKSHQGVQVRARKARPLPQARLVAVTVPAEPELPHDPVKNGDLLPHHCRWPNGDPGTESFSFCGANRVAPLPYCRSHIVIAFQLPKKRVG
jgi:GcrA cell cycle regulator